MKTLSQDLLWQSAAPGRPSERACTWIPLPESHPLQMLALHFVRIGTSLSESLCTAQTHQSNQLQSSTQCPQWQITSKGALALGGAKRGITEMDALVEVAVDLLYALPADAGTDGRLLSSKLPTLLHHHVSSMPPPGLWVFCN
jgi:hypothetical protein